MVSLVRCFAGLTLAALVASGPAHAEDRSLGDKSAGDKDVIDYRRHIMNTLNEQSGALGMILSTAIPGDNIAAHLEAIMLKSFDGEGELMRLVDDADAVVIGPAAGVGAATVGKLLALARTGAALVVDADALTSFRDDPARLFANLDRDDVMTPHEGEFERIFPGLLASDMGRLAATREAARKAGCVVLLKGPDTVIATPDGRAAINTNGSPWLATAGSGDVLAGLVAGLIAQGLDSFDAACAAVWIHADAAALFGPGLIAEDLPGLIPAVLKKLHAIG